jgi:hypothetical protein
MNAIGAKLWAIPEGYIPGWSNGPEPEFTSHETACLLNTADQDAHVLITIFFLIENLPAPIESQCRRAAPGTSGLTN